MNRNIKGNRTLLLVDDEENILLSLTRLLRHEGYTILSADSGRQGLSLLKKHSVDVILSDQKMPEMTGVEFLSKAKILYPDTIRIILSGYTDLESILNAINKGEIFKYVTKPWDNDLLVKSITEAFEQYELKQENKRLTDELKLTNSALEEANKILRQNDELTSLPNRMFLTERLSEAIKLSQKNNSDIALMVIDIDRFKNINESLGHDIGDELLKYIAARLNLLVSESDFLARLGGDEFGIVLHNITNEFDVSNIAKKVIEELSKPYKIEEFKLYATASIGISIFPYDGDSNMTLLKNADSAMYRAKERGKNNFQYYSHEMSNRAKTRVSL